MKKTLCLIVPLIFFIGCETEENEPEVDPFVGTWGLTFMGEYDNADCTGGLDSLGWAFMSAFGVTMTLTLEENGTASLAAGLAGDTETSTGTYENGQLCILDECFPLNWMTEGTSFYFNLEDEEEYCADFDEEEQYDEYTDASSCEGAGYYWYGASCAKYEFEKQ